MAKPTKLPNGTTTTEPLPTIGEHMRKILQCPLRAPLSPPGWKCTKQIGHDGPCEGPAFTQGPARPSPDGEALAYDMEEESTRKLRAAQAALQMGPGLQLPPVPEAAPDEDAGAVLAVRMPLDFEAFGAIMNVMGKVHGNGKIRVDMSQGNWAVFRLKGKGDK